MKQEAYRIFTRTANHKLINSKYSNIKIKAKQSENDSYFYKTIGHIICTTRYKHNVTNTKFRCRFFCISPVGRVVLMYCFYG